MKATRPDVSGVPPIPDKPVFRSRRPSPHRARPARIYPAANDPVAPSEIRAPQPKREDLPQRRHHRSRASTEHEAQGIKGPSSFLRSLVPFPSPLSPANSSHSSILLPSLCLLFLFGKSSQRRRCSLTDRPSCFQQQPFIFSLIYYPTHRRPPPPTMDFEPKSPSYMDAAFGYDALANLDSYVQYPHSPFVGIQMGRTCQFSTTYLHSLTSRSCLIVPGAPSASPRLSFNSLNLTSNLTDYASYPATSSYTTAPSPARPYTPPDGAGISPAGIYTLSAGELSSDGTQSGRRGRGSGTHSPASSSQGVTYSAAVPRSHRFNPIAPPPPTRRATKRKATRDLDSDDEDEDFNPTTSPSAGPDSRRETIRKQRIESEQRRRDELREGYARLRETLPASNQKASKVSLLDRGTFDPSCHCPLPLLTSACIQPRPTSATSIPFATSSRLDSRPPRPRFTASDREYMRSLSTPSPKLTCIYPQSQRSAHAWHCRAAPRCCRRRRGCRAGHRVGLLIVCLVSSSLSTSRFSGPVTSRAHDSTSLTRKPSRRSCAARTAVHVIFYTCSSRTIASANVIPHILHALGGFTNSHG